MTKSFCFRNRPIKIVATIGPAACLPDGSPDEAKLTALFEAGVDVARLNFSHGTHAEHGARYHMIREISKKTGRQISVIGDLQGPKLRLGTFANKSVDLKEGQAFRLDLDTKTPGTEIRVSMPHPEIFAAAEAGKTLLLDDGKVRLKILKVGKDFMETEVVAGTRISDRKGVNVPDFILPLSPFTPKDIADLDFILDLGVDWVFQSFVQRPEDVQEGLDRIKGRAPLLIKLEKPQAIQNLEAIMELADGFMVARGDLGVEMPPEDVPQVQKRIVREARRIGKPVIVATQMLESMITAPTPTRAEASDVATAVYDGADAIMLSAESAAGSYPIESVQMMDRIARRTQEDPMYRTNLAAQKYPLQNTAADAITAAAYQAAETVGAKAIVVYTLSGQTALRAARERPSVPILVLTSRLETARRLVLSFGLCPVFTEDVSNFDGMVQGAVRAAEQSGLAGPGDKIVITSGVPFKQAGSTNILHVATIPGGKKSAESGCSSTCGCHGGKKK